MQSKLKQFTEHITYGHNNDNNHYFYFGVKFFRSYVGPFFFSNSYFNINSFMVALYANFTFLIDVNQLLILSARMVLPTQ